jgi:hypothetical protein
MERSSQSRWLDLAALAAFLVGGLLIVWSMNAVWPGPFTGFILVPLAILVHGVLVRAAHWQWGRVRRDRPPCRVIRILERPMPRPAARPWKRAA